jgi:predicted small metal-binding protein
LEDDISEGHVAYFSIQPDDAVTADAEASGLSDGKAYYTMHRSFVSEVITMGFTVKCPMCSTQMNAESMDDLMKQGMEHAKTAHGITSVPPAVLAQLQAAVKKT